MNRVEFMRQLESLLQNISLAEREEALQYYNDYFNDAGEENEQSVIEALGNPAKVAENIKRDLYGSGYGDAAYHGASAENRAVVQYNQPFADTPESSGRLSTGVIVLIVVLCVLASPFLAGVACAVAGVLLGVAAIWLALIASAGIVAVTFLIVALVFVVLGFMCIIPSPLAGIALLGVGMVCAGIGILFLMLTVAMAGIATPAICRGIVSLCRRLSGRKQTV